MTGFKFELTQSLKWVLNFPEKENFILFKKMSAGSGGVAEGI